MYGDDLMHHDPATDANHASPVFSEANPAHDCLYERTAHHEGPAPGSSGGVAPAPGPSSSPAFWAPCVDDALVPVPGPGSSPAFWAHD
eukprot:12410206-Karenia_brevis.AAC.1